MLVLLAPTRSTPVGEGRGEGKFLARWRLKTALTLTLSHTPLRNSRGRVHGRVRERGLGLFDDNLIGAIHLP